MSVYLDTSAIVSLLVTEPASARLQDWLEADDEVSLATSAWVDTEVASALSLKVRTGELTVEQRADAATEWRRWSDSLTLLPIDRPVFQTAAAFAARHDLGLRAGDALHLAIAADHGCALVTLDARMAKAAPELGVRVTEIPR